MECNLNQLEGGGELQPPRHSVGELDGALSSPFWTDSSMKPDGDLEEIDDEEINGDDDEDDEEQLDKSNSEYVLSLPENPLPSPRRNLKLQQTPPRQKAEDEPLAKRQQLPLQQPLEKRDAEVTGGVVDLLRDLEDDEDFDNPSVQPTPETAESSATCQTVPCPQDVFTEVGAAQSFTAVPTESHVSDEIPSSSILGLNLTGYFDDDDEDDYNKTSTSTIEAMKLLTDSLEKVKQPNLQEEEAKSQPQ